MGVEAITVTLHYAAKKVSTFRKRTSKITDYADPTPNPDVSNVSVLMEETDLDDGNAHNAEVLSENDPCNATSILNARVVDSFCCNYYVVNLNSFLHGEHGNGASTYVIIALVMPSEVLNGVNALAAD